MRNLKFSVEEYYHLYNRGVDRRKIFMDNRDYERFITNLYLANSNKKFEMSKHQDEHWSFAKALLEDRKENIVSIGAYCLMPNHFHLLIREETDGGISKFMQKLTTAYTMYFNKKYHRAGSLFEGTFKAANLDSDNYLKYLFAYIHLNPIGIIDSGWKNKKIVDRKKAEEFVKSYTYSSFLDYVDKERAERVILNREIFPKYFENAFEFDDMIKEWINFN